MHVSVYGDLLHVLREAKSYQPVLKIGFPLDPLGAFPLKMMHTTQTNPTSIWSATPRSVFIEPRQPQSMLKIQRSWNQTFKLQENERNR